MRNLLKRIRSWFKCRRLMKGAKWRLFVGGREVLSGTGVSYTLNSHLDPINVLGKMTVMEHFEEVSLEFTNKSMTCTIE